MIYDHEEKALAAFMTVGFRTGKSKAIKVAGQGYHAGLDAGARISLNTQIRETRQSHMIGSN